ncbi:MAG: hypothetical protein CBE49_001880 [Rickettsiales bacterium TMED289]|nr:hypothetical protein [Gammaproteobacteria bacterium]RPF74460.1 MAG: hypothetical protein CBE49_001880 [Rickettsiales bacterium TMED289]|tara:strand:+ start:328 stop:633 length:306 start_codon:yes stop_codon:yes gene_type:complete
MKYLYLLIALLILAACGPKNLFDGSYEGTVEGMDITVVVDAESLSLTTPGETPINCIIDDYTENPTTAGCTGGWNASIEIKGKSLIIIPEDQDPGVFKRIE